MGRARPSLDHRPRPPSQALSLAKPTFPLGSTRGDDDPRHRPHQRRERRRRRGLPNGGGVLFLDQRAIAGSGGAGLLGWIPGVAKKRPPPQPKKRPPAALSRA